MEVHFHPELEAKLADSAAKLGRNPDEFVQEVMGQYLDEEAHFIAAVNHGESALQRGEFLSHEEVAERLTRFL